MIVITKECSFESKKFLLKFVLFYYKNEKYSSFFWNSRSYVRCLIIDIASYENNSFVLKIGTSIMTIQSSCNKDSKALDLWLTKRCGLIMWIFLFCCIPSKYAGVAGQWKMEITIYRQVIKAIVVEKFSFNCITIFIRQSYKNDKVLNMHVYLSINKV